MPDDTRALREDDGPRLWVGQEDPNGCGIACVAMLTGKTYAEVKAEAEADERVRRMSARPISEGGLHGPALEHVLQRAGYWLRTEYEVRCDEWPPSPFSALHICQVVQPSGNHHFVVMLGNGDVLDPLREGRFSLTDWPKVNHVLGLLHEPSNNATSEAGFIAGLRDGAEPSEAEVEAVVAVIKKDCCSYSDGDGSLGYGQADREYARVARAVLIAARKASP